MSLSYTKTTQVIRNQSSMKPHSFSTRFQSICLQSKENLPTTLGVLPYEKHRTTYSLSAAGLLCICCRITCIAGSLMISCTSGSWIAAFLLVSGSSWLSHRWRPVWPSCTCTEQTLRVPDIGSKRGNYVPCFLAMVLTQEEHHFDSRYDKVCRYIHVHVCVWCRHVCCVSTL